MIKSGDKVKLIRNCGTFKKNQVVICVDPATDGVHLFGDSNNEHYLDSSEYELISSVVKNAKKFDNDKPDLSLLSKEGKEGVARALMYGAGKYGRYNYLNGMKWTRLISAADRHLTAFTSGEDNDPESKLNHLYHAGANLMMLIEYYEKEIGEDDRYKPS